MPVLKHPRRERFAQEIAKGMPQLKAYGIAGYKPNDGNASKLVRRPEVVARVREITGRGAKRAEVTVESICRELEEAREIASQERQPGSMVMASMGKAKIARLLEDVVKHVGPDGQAIKHSIEVRFVDAPEESEEP